MPLTITLARSIPAGLEAHAVAMFEGQSSGGGVDWVSLEAQRFHGRRGEVRVLSDSAGHVTFVVGVGPAAMVDANVVRHACGGLARAARRYSTLSVDFSGCVRDELSPARVAQAIAEGLVLGGYRFLTYKADPTPTVLERVTILGGGGQRVQAAIDRGVVIAEAVNRTRDLVNEPGGTLTPIEFAKRAVKEGQRAGFTVTVWDEKEIRQQRLGGLLGISRGSFQAPRFLQLSYEPAKPRCTVALVGKGVTFDSGGLSLKSSEGMVGMKEDMAGAAAVLGAMSAIATLGAKVRVLGFLPLTDNMTGGDATRVGDVLTIRNGTTVEVLNTDAEGRLLLADALSLASEHEPDAIVDLATLTGACMVGLGERIAGLMSNHAGWSAQVCSAAERAGEWVWPLPLPPYLKGKLRSDIADLKNITGLRYGGTLAAGVFLEHFVAGDIPWVHLDIAGPADAPEVDGEIVKGGTGFGVRTLVEMIDGFVKPKPIA
jgi:leucyl aminopeptidase